MTKEEQIKDWFIHKFWPVYPSKWLKERYRIIEYEITETRKIRDLEEKDESRIN